MAAQQSIEVDLELHKLIENARISLEESRRAIIVRALRGTTKHSQAEESAAYSVVPRASRSRGIYELCVFGESYKEGSLKGVLKTVLLKLADRDDGFLEAMSRIRTQRGRHIVARTPHEVYPGRPQLVKAGCAEQLDVRWYFDTNISKNGLKRYVELICDAAGVAYGSDVTLSF